MGKVPNKREQTELSEIVQEERTPKTDERLICLAVFGIFSRNFKLFSRAELSKQSNT
jgi:hypothetical protein